MAAGGRSSAMGLSLTGAQIGSLMSSNTSSTNQKKRPSSASTAKVHNQRPGSAAGGSSIAASREKSSSMNSLNLSGSSTQLGARTKNTKPSSPTRSSKPDSRNNSARSTNSKNSNDFLALFESNHQPKLRGKSSSSKMDWYGKSPKSATVQQLPTRNKPAWLTGPPSDANTSANKYSSHTNTMDQFIDPEDDRYEFLSSEHDDSRPILVDSSSRSPEMNNRTSMALSPSTKMAFMDIENAYQNLTHKTPINQVKGGSSRDFVTSPLPPRNSAAEDFMRELTERSATKIQRWFRQIIEKRHAQEALLSNTNALKRLLEEKRQEHEALMRNEEDREFERMEGAERDQETRRQHKEKKARQERLDAVQDLKKRRSDKKEESKRIAQRELADLEASGRVGGAKKRSTNKKPSSPSTRSEWTNRDDALSNELVQRLSLEDLAKEPSPWANQRSSPRSDSAPRPQLSNQNSRHSSSRGSKTTMDDIMATLKELEADEQFTERKPAEKRMAWLDDLDQEGEESMAASDRGSETFPATDDKLKSIMSFLDQVDTQQRISQIEQMSAADDLSLPPIVPSSEEIQQMEQVSRDASDVTAAMLSQRMELDESKRSLQMLQKALNQQRELTVRHARETDKEMKRKLIVQKDDYEETIKRHLGFIDQLIDDKKSLGDKCELLVREMKSAEKKYTDKMKHLLESHDVELRKIKDVQAAAEKLRREKWIDEKTKKIKEMTVKGLEPEIQRLIAKQKAEMKRVKSLHEAELLEADERAGQKYVRMTEELRDQLHTEKEAACAREREMAKHRYEKQIEQEEESYQVQRRRLYAEVQDEKERLNSQAGKQRSELDQLQKQLEETHSHSVSVMRQEYEKARDEQERRHAAEIKEHEERLRIEKEAWEENYMKKQETWLMTKERELKDRVRKDRDKEIEMVIDRLENDATSSREECERLAENKIKRIRDKYESEIVDLERSERLAMEKYNEIKARMTEVEGDNEQLKVLIKQKDRDKNEIVKMMDKLNKERDHVSDIIRQEFADRLVITDEENKRLKNDMSELKARLRIEGDSTRAEIEQINKAKEEEMEEVHKRVKQAIAKKEDVVQQLRKQNEAAIKRADHLEGLLEQQRKQLLKR